MLITAIVDVPQIVNQLMLIGMYIFPFYIFFSIFLFECLGWMAYSMLNILSNHIEIAFDAIKIKNKQHDVKLEDWRRQLTTWKVQYYSIGEFIYRINNCFRLLLLLVVASYFVKMINNSFTLFLFMRGTDYGHRSSQSNILYGLFLLMKDFLTFCSLVYIPHLIQKEVEIYIIREFQENFTFFVSADS